VFRSFEPLVLTVIGVACLAGLDIPLTRSRRFGGRENRTIRVSAAGVEGEAYPLTWYSSDHDSRTDAGQHAVVVRSRFVRLVAERAERPNFISWSKSTIVVFREKGSVLASFWGQYPPADNPIFHGVVVVIPEGSLPRFLQFASCGGADIHITLELLSEAGSMAAVYCARHSRRERWNNFPIYLPRVGRSSSLADYVAWIR
jgi:hypothetical protein